MLSTFKFVAKDASGRTVKGTIKADTQTDVVADLRRRRLTPVGIKKAGGGLGALAQQAKQKTASRASCKKGELEVFTRQLSTMLGAGIPMLEALEILGEQADSPGFTFCLNRIV